MRVRYIIFLLVGSALFWTCQNLEDSNLSRRTFINLYEGPYDITAHDIEIISDGYVVVGDMSISSEGSSSDSIVTVVFKTDKRGNQIGDFYYFMGGSGKSIVRHPDGGYVIVGDSIKKDLSPQNVADGLIASARILVLDENFMEVFRATNSGTEDSIRTDYYGGSVTIDENGNIIVLGTYVEGIGTQTGVPERPFIKSLTKNIDNSLSQNWQQEYDLIDRNYRNSISVHASNNSIIWASGIARDVGDVTVSYVSIPFVEQNSVFINSSTIGASDIQLFLPNDIQPATSSAFGYGVVGSYSEPNATDGSKSNMFFLRVNSGGTIVEGSERYFDAILSADNSALTDNTLSSIKDEGLAITSTSDGGYVLCGTMETIPEKGNGARDILLVKVNSIGDPIWNKTIGGTGDEVPCSIKETSDGGLLICGTNTLGSASSVFIIKTDKNGELKN